MSTPQSCPFRLDPRGSDQHGENERLHELGPVVRVELPGGVEAWAAVGQEELRALLADPRIGKDARHWDDYTAGRVPEGWPLLGMVTIPGMTSADGADHRRLRGLVSQAFTPRRVEELRPHVEAVVAELLDGLERAAKEAGGAAVDLREHFAYPLPMRVIGELLGIPEELQGQLHEYSRLLVSSSATAEESLAARRGLVALLARVAAEHRERPVDDLTGALIAARDEQQDRLSEQELVGTMMLMFVAGHATTLNLVTNAVRALSAFPAQLAAVREGRAGWADVVEEALRYDSPVAHFPMRFALEDVEVGGVVIGKGDAVLASYTAAGRDPRQYDAPAEFRLDRGPTRHLSLGHGPHFCLGAPLARLEAETALRELYDRFPQLTAVADNTEPIASFVSNSRTTLPVRLRP